jgi:hypothetical protein
MYETCHQSTIRIKVISGEINSLSGTNIKNTNFLIQSTLDGVVCSVITAVQMGEMSKLGCLIGWSIRDMWADSLYFLFVMFGSIYKTFASFQHILWPSSYARWANFEFSSRSCVRLYLCSLMRTYKAACFTM